MSKQSKTEQARAQAYAAKQAAYAAKSGRRKQDNKIAVIASVIVLALAFASQLVYSNFGPGHSAAASASPSPSATVPAKTIAQNRTWTGDVTFNVGSVKISLDGKKAPQAVSNFISLANHGFYNNVKCHRLTNGGFYVLQCGDPAGNGTGGPGYSFGPIENAPANGFYAKGVLAMARHSAQQDPNAANSMGSQFFIVYKDTTLPNDDAGGYTVFGKIESGLENLKATINGGIKPDAAGKPQIDGTPKVPAVIKSIILK
ncbi:MAG: hypothetical protein RLZZ626_195 [Actinomycetota bacterium]|jgi:peptidyl-prolyl cis-trans isomerase B (cyclophilin B)